MDAVVSHESRDAFVTAVEVSTVENEASGKRLGIFRPSSRSTLLDETFAPRDKKRAFSKMRYKVLRAWQFPHCCDLRLMTKR